MSFITHKIRRAYRKGRDGEANINAEAADRIAKLLEEDDA